MEYKKYLCDIRRYTNQAAEFEEKARKLANVANYLKENKSGSKDLDVSNDNRFPWSLDSC